MPRFAIIHSTLVENVILAESGPTIPGRTVVGPLSATVLVSPGDSWNGSSFTPAALPQREQDKRAATDNLSQAYATLKQWSADAQATYDTAVAGNRALTAAEQREFLRRVGVFFNRFADLLRAQGLES